MLLKITLGGKLEFALFAGSDAFQCTAIVTVFPVADFDENQHRAIQHDQVDLAGLAAKVACHQRQSLLQEIVAAGLFRQFADVKMRGVRHSPVQVADAAGREVAGDLAGGSSSGVVSSTCILGSM